MRRCKSWRPLKGATLTGDTRPGGKARAWKLCRNKVGEGRTRCDECVNALASHHDPAIRLALAKEPDLDDATIEFLASDQDLGVSLEARKRTN